jgi:hypothetical protein
MTSGAVILKNIVYDFSSSTIGGLYLMPFYLFYSWKTFFNRFTFASLKMFMMLVLDSVIFFVTVLTILQILNPTLLC